jgi:hypothetical protein
MVIWGLVVLLTAALIGIPLSLACTGMTVALGGIAAFLVLLGLRTRSAAMLTTAVGCGLLQELVALVETRQPPAPWSALLLGIVAYLLLDMATFAAYFHGVAVDKSVWRMQAVYWGSTAVLSGLTGVLVVLLAAVSAQRFTGPLLLQGVAVAAASVIVGAVLGAVRAWRQQNGSL